MGGASLRVGAMHQEVMCTELESLNSGMFSKEKADTSEPLKSGLYRWNNLWFGYCVGSQDTLMRALLETVKQSTDQNQDKGNKPTIIKAGENEVASRVY